MTPPNGPRQGRVDSWKRPRTAPKTAAAPARAPEHRRAEAITALPAAATPAPAHAPFDWRELMELQVAAGRVPDLERRARRAEEREAEALRRIDAERRERQATLGALMVAQDRVRALESSEAAVTPASTRPAFLSVAAAFVLGLSLLGWRLHSADVTLDATTQEARRVALERDQARTHVAGLTEENHSMRESLRDERDRSASLLRGLEEASRELDTRERAARAFGESLAKLIRGE